MKGYWKLLGLDPANKKLTQSYRVTQKIQSTWTSWTFRVAIFLLAAIAATAISIYEYQLDVSSHDYVVGEPSPRTLFSPLSINYIDSVATERIKKERTDAVYPIYRIDPIVNEKILKKVDTFFTNIQDAKKIEEGSVKLNIQSPPFEVSEFSLNFLLSYPNLDEARKELQLLFEQTLPKGILADETKFQLMEQKQFELSTIDAEGIEKKKMIQEIRSLNEVHQAVNRLLSNTLLENSNLRRSLVEVFYLVMEPNLIYDVDAVLKRKEAIAASVPSIEEKIKKDELIVQRGMLVTQANKMRIDRVELLFVKKKNMQRIASVGVFMCTVYFLFFIYLYFFERIKLQSYRMILLYHTVFLLTLAICKAVYIWPPASPYLMPFSLAALLLALLLDTKQSIVATIVVTALIAPLTKFQADLLICSLLCGFSVSFAAIKVRKRIEFLRVGVILGFIAFLSLFATSLFKGGNTLDLLEVTARNGLLNGAFITIPLVFLLLPIFENLFNLTTDATLLELSDLNHPLLRRMIIEAPGTYHHSLVVSRLAEGACEKIGANALLARVGCYFHDIGKIARSEYFVENQSGRPNKHDKLTPAMSSMLILSHVKEGMELGKKYKLKDSVLHFIPEHQGTGVIYYFYRKALEQAEPGVRVNPDDFRYPGPNPQSRETAVALLADSIEAASRSIKDPNAESLRSLVRKIINDKFIDGQLNECNLTLSDLHKIQESFVSDLMAIFHTRVAYPTKPDVKDAPDLFLNAKKNV
jgi:putative nucleotidyltransferase with HDIG domain